VVESKKGIPVHLCQGYEAANKEYFPIKDAIDEAYLHKIPKLTVSPHMNRFLEERFGVETDYVGQMINRDIFFPAMDTPGRGDGSFTIMVVGMFDADVKNIRTVLYGISIARSRLSFPLKVVRVSPFPLTREEEMILKPDEYHSHVPYHSMGNIYREADIFISLSKEAEGFGLPAVEAMGCGVPAILSRISSYTSLDEPLDYALFVDSSDHNALAEAIVELLHNRPLRERLRQRGLTVAEKFTREKMASRLNCAFEEIKRRDNLLKARKASLLRRFLP
jgi:glycosyltransferase involved in cell wall biosynthesis